MAEGQELGALFHESATIMERLRGTDGCPWDREQTPDSIRKYTLEETYEVLDAIERRDWPNLAEELGDLLLQVLFYAQLASEAGHFTLVDVLDGLNRKLVRRHPHVFGEAASAAAGNAIVSAAGNTAGNPALAHAIDTAGVLRNWQAIKQMEKQARAGSSSAEAAGYLAGVVRGQGALSEAAKLGSAAAHAGFDWPDVQGLLAKVREETAEIEVELSAALSTEQSPEARYARMHEEVGDLLFTAANLARRLKIDADISLRDANAKFRRRFEAMEQASERKLEDCSAEELEQAWAAVKAGETERL